MDPVTVKHTFQSITASDYTYAHYGDNIAYLSGHYVHDGPRPLLAELRRRQGQLNEMLKGFAGTIAALEEGAFGEEESRQYDDMLTSINVLNVAITGKSDLAMLKISNSRHRESLQSKRWRDDADEELAQLAELSERLTEVVSKAIDSIVSRDRTFDFDQELRDSRAYAGHQTTSAPLSTAEQTPDTSVSLATASFRSESLLTANTSFFGSANSASRSQYASSSYAEIEVVGHSGVIDQTLLLDTGAFQDCISQALLQELQASAPVQIRRLPEAKTLLLGNRTTATSNKVVKLKWRFKRKADEYDTTFNVVDDLVHDLIISSPSIFKHEFLSRNPEVCVLGLPEHLRPDFENVLGPLGLPTLSKEKARDQKQRVQESKAENDRLRAVDNAEVQRLADEKRRKVEQYRQAQAQ